MKILRSLSILFLVIFVSLSNAFGKEEVPSIKFFLFKLEKDIQSHKPQKVIRGDVKEILKAKEQLPVNHVPELNYLLKEQVEILSSTEISKLKDLVKIVLPLETGAEILIFLLCFYPFILFFQTIKTNVWIKRLSTLSSILLLLASLLLNFSYLLFFLLGIGFFILYKFKKFEFLIALIVSGILIYSIEIALDFSFKLIKSPQFLYTIKIKRDGYAPPFLIEKALERNPKAILEEVTSDLSLGELNSVKKIKKIPLTSQRLKAIKFNDLGYVEFLKKNYKKALNYFEKAHSLSENYQVLYNLYLTHSALLNVEEADKFRRELEEKYSFTGAPSTPLLIHVPAKTNVKPNFQLPLIVSVFTGILFGLTLIKVTRQSFGFEERLLFIPGMKSFLNGKLQVFIIASTLGAILNALVGSMLCRI